MTDSTAAGLTVEELQRLLRAADPAALLVPPRLLRRVIKQHARLSGFGLQVPHRKSYVLPRDDLFRIVTRGELGLTGEPFLPETLLLFPVPHPGKLRDMPTGATLLKYWRLLFHARVHQAVEKALGPDDTGAASHERVRLIGPTEFDEIREVLRQEFFLLPPGNDRAVYEEFAALYLELRCFAPHRLRSWFPAVDRFDVVNAVLDDDVDAEALFTATRLHGAPDPAPGSPQRDEGDPTSRAEISLDEDDGEAPAPPPAPPQPDEAAHGRLMRRAEQAAAKGNDVRAAILRTQAQRVAPPGKAGETQAAAFAAVAHLVERLQAALMLPVDDLSPWRQGLTVLLAPAAGGYWPLEGRLLYDLQKVCIDQEREVYAVDLVEWIRSFGQLAIKRLLPHQRQVNLVRHLRGAVARLASARIAAPERKRLVDLLHGAVARSEEQLRDRFRPLLGAALDDVNLKPRNYAERVARGAVIEELLDRVVERGFLSMDELRDALARNRLKLADLSGPGEFFLGDPLIRANRRLAVSLAGVYHRGEIYRRWLQRFSSALFGTAVGRFLTLYLILPFGGAFSLLVAVQHISEAVAHWVAGRQTPPAAEAAAVIGAISSPGPMPGPLLAVASYSANASLPEPFELVHWWSVGLLGLFLFLLLHVAAFRRQVVEAAWAVWRGLRGLFYDLPAVFAGLPVVWAFFTSRLYLAFYQYIFKPLVGSVVVGGALYLLDGDLFVMAGGAAAVFLALTVLLHSRLGLLLEEVWTDVLVRTWRLFRADVLPGLVRLVLFLFRRLVEGMERVIYTVDEWLRFRGGDSRASLVVKAVLGLIWFVVTYVFRFVINLVAEPQLNPIKHFPMVTVAHKTLLPVTLALHLQLKPVLGELNSWLLVGALQFILPGIVGFLVWEFKENWRLYRANQPPTLRPQIVSAHGETVPRLLRPGFHSGALPKLYARLRHVRDAGAGKQHEALHHVEEDLHRFVDRNLLAVLVRSTAWGSTGRIQIVQIHLATNRIRVELTCLNLDGRNIHLDLEEHAGRLLAGITMSATGDPESRHSWLDHLPLGPVRAFTDALAGFYCAAGVDLVREQVESLLPPGAIFVVEERGLVVWPEPESETAVVYDLREGPLLAPRTLTGTPALLRKLQAERLFLTRTPVRWDDWVETWERDQAGKDHKPPLLRGVQLLPPTIAKNRLATRSARRRKR